MKKILHIISSPGGETSYSIRLGRSIVEKLLTAYITFKYDEKGPKGLVEGKKVYLAIASGGTYSEGPMKSFDFVTPYLQSILSFIGLTDITIVRAEGTSMPGTKDIAIETAISRMDLPMAA